MFALIFKLSQDFKKQCHSTTLLKFCQTITKIYQTLTLMINLFWRILLKCLELPGKELPSQAYIATFRLLFPVVLVKGSFFENLIFTSVPSNNWSSFSDFETFSIQINSISLINEMDFCFHNFFIVCSKASKNNLG